MHVLTSNLFLIAKKNNGICSVIIIGVACKMEKKYITNWKMLCIGNLFTFYSKIIYGFTWNK